MNLSRRNFLKGGIVSAAAGGAAVVGLSGCSTQEDKLHYKNISKKTSDGRSVGSKGKGNYKVLKAEDIEGAVKKSSEVWGMNGKKVPVIEAYMPYKGFKTFFRIAGEGNSKKAPLILLHGGPGGGCDTLEVLDRLALIEGRQLISYDQIGCGRSYVEGHTDWWNLDTWMDELIAFRDYLGLDQAHLIGQSYGGMLIIAYLIEKKPNDICSAIITSGHCSSSLWAAEQHRLIKFLSVEDQAAIAKAESTGDFTDSAYLTANSNYSNAYCNSDYKHDPNAPECFKRGPAKGHDAVYNAGWGPNEYNPTGSLKDFEYIDRLGEISQSCLILNGTNDCCTPLMAKTMYEGISDSKWKLFQGSRHRCYYEAIDEYVPLVNEWMCDHE